MAQVQRIDLLQNNFACATAKFPATYPVFLSGKVTRDVFFADVEEAMSTDVPAAIRVEINQ